MRRFILLVLVLVLGFGLTGCAKYNVHPLNRLPLTHESAQTVDQVTVCYQPLNYEQTRHTLGKNLAKSEYRATQFTIFNQGQLPVTFKQDGLSIEQTDPRVVAEACHFSTARRVGGYGALGLILWPFLIPAAVDGVNSYESNQKMDKDFDLKALVNNTVMPGDVLNGVVFSPQIVGLESINLILWSSTSDQLHYAWKRGVPMSRPAD